MGTDIDQITPSQLFWNMFAHPIEANGREYLFLTDRRELIEASGDVVQQIRRERLSNRPDLDNFTAEQKALFQSVGLLQPVDARRQFSRVMHSDQDDRRELLHIITSYACNLSCSYCFMLGELDKHPEKLLSFQQAKQAIDIYFAEPHRQDSVVHFYGGEPLLHIELIERCLNYIFDNYSNKIVPKIITNGLIHSDRAIELLRKYPFDISVSMDGDRVAHDVFRLDHSGRSSFDKTVEGIKAFQDAGLDCKILITVGQHNIDRLPEVVDAVLDLAPKAIALNYPRALPSLDNNIEREGEAVFWVDQYLAALERCYARNVPELYFTDMLFALLTAQPVLRPCAACGAQLSVGPGGVVGPCQAFVAAGKFSKKIADDGCATGTDTAFAPWSNVSKASSKKCTACSIAPICGGDCSFDRYNRTKNLNEPLPFHCDLRLAMAQKLGSRLALDLPLGFVRAGPVPA